MVQRFDYCEYEYESCNFTRGHDGTRTKRAPPQGMQEVDRGPTTVGVSVYPGILQELPQTPHFMKERSGVRSGLAAVRLMYPRARHGPNRTCLQGSTTGTVGLSRRCYQQP